MNVGQVVQVVVGALIAYIIATTICTTLITGTSNADNLITNIVPIVCAAGAVVVILRNFLR